MINESPTVSKQRIDYVDLMKGVCIILVVLEHCDIRFVEGCKLESMLEHMRMPLYFFLAGLFYKRYDGVSDFTVRKINKLIIPYLFFSLLFIVPDALFISSDELTSRVMTKTYFYWLVAEPTNCPLWFLKCLFIVYMLYYLFDVISSGKIPVYVQLAILIAVSYGIVSIAEPLRPLIDSNKIVEFLFRQRVLSAVVALPFFFMAHHLRSYILHPILKKSHIVFVMLFSMPIWAIFSCGGVNFSHFEFGNRLVYLYLGGIGGILSVGCLCALVGKLPFVSYIGRYSIIVLATHWAVMESFQQFGVSNKTLLAVIVLTFMPLMIFLFKRYTPGLCAQKDILKLKNSRFLFYSPFKS